MRTILIALCTLTLTVSCGKSKDDSKDSGDGSTPAPAPTGGGGGSTPAATLDLPLVVPPVKTATPTGFLAINTSLALTDLDPSEFKSRFFEDGPTNLFGILGDVDERLKGLNEMAKTRDAACTKADPVAYDLTPAGQTVPFYAQCYQKIGSTDPKDPGFLQWGVKDGVTYLYVAVGASHVAAKLTPVEGVADAYKVQVWAGVGYTNTSGCSATWDGCSYGVMEIAADSAAKTFEMAVAGTGFGYCGAQLRSDGTAIYAKGSADGPSCAAPATLCADAADLTKAGTCGDALQTFTLAALGRKENTAVPLGASAYPETPNVTLDGGATDSLAFGPAEPTAGVGDFDASK